MDINAIEVKQELYEWTKYMLKASCDSNFELDLQRTAEKLWAALVAVMGDPGDLLAQYPARRV